MMKLKKLISSRKYKIVILLSIYGLCMFYWFSNSPKPGNLEITRKNIERTIEEALKTNYGTGCHIPQLDPFASEIMKFSKNKEKVSCKGKDLVKCYLSKCKVNEEAVKSLIGFSCAYRDIIYESDGKYYLGNKTVLTGIQQYTLNKSDHVKIECTWNTNITGSRKSWTGYGWGIRSSIKASVPPAGKENTVNVLIFGFDSTAHNGFIRKMPLSYGVLKELGASVLKGYNVVGDGTPAALLPILTGKTELEMPEMRKSINGSGYVDEKSFIFYKLRNDGYRTAYIEDSPSIGTFQYRFNGFQRQPTDHYALALFLEASKMKKTDYCLGDTPQYQIMMNITEQILKLDGKSFSFTFIVDITHDDFNIISTADEAFVEFLRNLKKDGHLENTLLIVMGDHGPRYSDVRKSYQGKLEERLPLMAIRLPEQLKIKRPEVQKALEANINVLTTPHDIHATILDAVDLRQFWNPYKIRGADVRRGLTLLEPIPSNRSCSEAGIEPHWCSCLQWKLVSESDPLRIRVAQALVAAINEYTQFERANCAERALKNIEWVMKNKVNVPMLQFSGAKDRDGYYGNFHTGVADNFPVLYQVRLTVSPGNGEYEAMLTFNNKTNGFTVYNRQISRTNAYGDEPGCIKATYPHINMYCYCINKTNVNAITSTRFGVHTM